ELAAIMLHRRGKRRAQPFVHVDCSVIGADGSASKLIGEFDGAGRRQGPGLIEAANRGALFLDGIDKLDLASQALVLSAIEERQIRIGSKGEAIPVDARVIATSRQDLRDAVDQGQFREDLYYALNVVRLRIPPLRERKADIPLLFSHFLDEAATQLRRDPPRMNDRVRRRLIEHDWPGNVRELRSFAYQTLIGFDDQGDSAHTAIRRTLAEQVEQFEAATIRAALEETEGSASEAMQLLSLPRKTFYDKLNRHRIDIGAFRQPGGVGRKRGR
ncbi:MAG: sigma-54-dependent Fis family transcriptional regulator, partial [Proteobacteria bacterium]|nr:sigma-54-dependent Fis family transcriptional regulator [Pseudomonadota bacterium]